LRLPEFTGTRFEPYNAVATYDRRVQRRALGLLFAALALGLGAVAVFSALAGGRAWIVAVAAAALALWLADLARKAIR
jgi:hypothetical protein